MSIAFELKDGIDHVFEYFGSGDAAIFGDVSDEKHRYVGFFGEALEFGGAFADLRNTTWGRVDVGCLQGLYGVDDYQFGFDASDLLEDVVGGCFGE